VKTRRTSVDISAFADCTDLSPTSLSTLWLPLISSPLSLWSKRTTKMPLYSTLKLRRGYTITRFYNEGFADGFSHGRIHGLIEGRALGKEKGYEMWEEIGFYEGFARTWGGMLSSTGKGDQYVLCLISRVPLSNRALAGR